MDPAKLKNLTLGEKELFIHDKSDLADYDTFFEFVIGNGEMIGRVDALHSQHIRQGAKKDVLCIRPVDVWGERTFPIHRGRPGGRFASKIEDDRGNAVGIENIISYDQRLDLESGILGTRYCWEKGNDSGENESEGFISKVRKHVMVHRYVDVAKSDGCTRTFSVETIFPYSSRASALYFNRFKGYRWETYYEDEIEPINNAKARIDPVRNLGWVTFSTEFPRLKTKVVWAMKPWPKPDRWEISKEKGGISMRWKLLPNKKSDVTIVTVVMTDRDCLNPVEGAVEEVEKAFAIGFRELKKEHIDWWNSEWGKSHVEIPDEKLQKLFQISLYYLLINVGGSYWNNIGVDNVIWETCMLDNIAAVNALVDTNHLEEARREFGLLDKYLPAAKKNAAERLKEILKVENSDAALLPFLMTEDGIEMWRHFGLHTGMNGFHFQGLLKTGRYENDEVFMKTKAYPWFRAYAEYARLNAVWDKKLDAYIYPIENAGTIQESYWGPSTHQNKKIYFSSLAEVRSLFRFRDYGPLKLFPIKDVSKLNPSNIDVVLMFMWIMELAAQYAEKFGLDNELKEKWRSTISNLYIPQTDQILLTNIGKIDAGDYMKKYAGISARLVGLFWPSEGTYELFERKKVEMTVKDEIDRMGIKYEKYTIMPCWRSSFVALSNAYLNRGDRTLRYLHHFLSVTDPRAIEMREQVNSQNYYYIMSYAMFILIVRNMLLQTYKGKIRVFPAVPSKWHDLGVAFTNLPAEGGYKISGVMNRQLSEVDISNKEGIKLVKLVGRFNFVEIIPSNLDPRNGSIQFSAEGKRRRMKISIFNVEEGRRYVVKTDQKEKVVKAGHVLSFYAQTPAEIIISPVHLEG